MKNRLSGRLTLVLLLVMLTATAAVTAPEWSRRSPSPPGLIEANIMSGGSSEGGKLELLVWAIVIFAVTTSALACCAKRKQATKARPQDALPPEGIELVNVNSKLTPAGTIRQHVDNPNLSGAHGPSLEEPSQQASENHLAGDTSKVNLPLQAPPVDAQTAGQSSRVIGAPEPGYGVPSDSLVVVNPAGPKIVYESTPVVVPNKTESAYAEADEVAPGSVSSLLRS